jgi:tRNA nucleotidyltransferase/poly(A) polymerase
MTNLVTLLAQKKYAAKVQELEADRITAVEKKIFDLLLEVVKDYQINTTLRVAGGWVRDKLLGKDSKDIDFALDNISGEKFARLVNKWMKNHGIETSSVGVIEANPEQSKHLETVTTFIFGLPIDFVNLRTESYAEGSRIPTVEVGTPEEDAYRRDLTINALFYNINTGQVEDLTGKGLDDLEKGIIRTPLNPLETFRDDPLRVLRSIRFASRYGFELDPDLTQAAQQPEIQYALKTKVSKERIGTELKGMMKSKDPAGALRLIKTLGLRNIVFATPEGLSPWDMDQRNPHHELLLWDHLIKVVGTLNELLKVKQIEGEERIILLLAAFLHDVGKLDSDIQGKKDLDGQMITTYHGHEDSSKNIAEHLLRELKFSNKEIQDVVDLIAPAGRAETLTRESKGPTRKALAKFVRMVGDKWEHAVYLAMADDASKKKGEIEIEKYQPYENLIKNVRGLNVEKAYEIKPLLNGHEIMQVLGIKPGPQIGQVSKALMDWQLEFPETSKENATQWVLSHYSQSTQKLMFDKNYLFYPVDKPKHDIPESLKKKQDHHITIISPEETPYVAKLARKNPEDLFGELYVDGQPQYLGLGYQRIGENELYYVVVKWPEVQELRRNFGLPRKDLHITLGYTYEDIHDVSKDETTLITKG